MKNWCICWFFHAYINEMTVQEAKFPVKISSIYIYTIIWCLYRALLGFSIWPILCYYVFTCCDLFWLWLIVGYTLLYILETILSCLVFTYSQGQRRSLRMAHRCRNMWSYINNKYLTKPSAQCWFFYAHIYTTLNFWIFYVLQIYTSLVGYGLIARIAFTPNSLFWVFLCFSAVFVPGHLSLQYTLSDFPTHSPSLPHRFYLSAVLKKLRLYFNWYFSCFEVAPPP
jgi:hypothetical protein